jgi:hypothetical protein
LSIDINSELKRMADEWGYTEKEATQVFRNCVRSMWGDSKFKTDTLLKASVDVVNTNPRSMKRYPVVKRYKCAICGELFGSSDIELDHLEDENTLTKFEHAEDFIKAIFFTSPPKLQVLCKDKKKKVKGKNQIVSFGCHGIKTYASRYGVSFEQAKAEKQALEIIKQKQDKEWLLEHGVTPSSTQAKRREQIVDKILENNS